MHPMNHVVIYWGGGGGFWNEIHHSTYRIYSETFLVTAEVTFLTLLFVSDSVRRK